MDERWQFLAPPHDGDVRRADAPTFSVIVAAYQAAEVIGDALTSALAQTSPPHEIIVCDDGSTDDLDGALAPFTDRIRVVRQRNGGEAAAKNAATAVAQGEFVVILDADDVYEPDRLEALSTLAQLRPDLDILTTDAMLELDGVALRRCYDGRHRFEVDDQRSAILRRNFVFGLAAVRRARFLEVGGFDESIARTADWELWIRLVMTGSRVGLVDAPLARYRVRQQSLSADRVGMARGGQLTLEKASRLPGLSAAERRAVADGITEQRQKALEREARRALLAGERTARRAALAVVSAPGFGTMTRLKAMIAAAVPRVARRRLARTAPDWTGAGGVEVRTIVALEGGPVSPPTVPLDSE